MHSRSADWVFGDARLISSTSTRLANTGPGRKTNARRVLVPDRDPGDVGGQQVGRALEAREVAAGGAGQALGEHRLPHARHVLDHHVAARQERDDARLEAGPAGRARPRAQASTSAPATDGGGLQLVVAEGRGGEGLRDVPRVNDARAAGDPRAGPTPRAEQWQRPRRGCARRRPPCSCAAARPRRPAPMMVISFSPLPKPMPSTETSLWTIRSRPLRARLARARARPAGAVLGREADQHLVAPRRAARSARMSSVGSRSRARRALGADLSILPSRGVPGRKSATAAAITSTSQDGERRAGGARAGRPPSGRRRTGCPGGAAGRRWRRAR